MQFESIKTRMEQRLTGDRFSSWLILFSARIIIPGAHILSYSVSPLFIFCHITPLDNIRNPQGGPPSLFITEHPCVQIKSIRSSPLNHTFLHNLASIHRTMATM